MESRPSRGSLLVVGSGIQLVSQMTPQARVHVERAQKVFFLAADPPTYEWLSKLNPTAESLHGFYCPGKDRMVSYLEMVEHILSHARKGLDVCVVSYGHPGVLGFPLHEAIRRASEEGLHAKMLPAISAEDCLFADVGVDPGQAGCQTFEATNFLIHKRKIDVCSPLVLWQIGLIGESGFKNTWEIWNPEGLQVLVEVLSRAYGCDHQVIIYEASQYPICEPRIDRVALAAVPKCGITPLSTMYVPPKSAAALDTQMLERLRIPRSAL